VTEEKPTVAAENIVVEEKEVLKTEGKTPTENVETLIPQSDIKAQEPIKMPKKIEIKNNTKDIEIKYDDAKNIVGVDNTKINYTQDQTKVSAHIPSIVRTISQKIVESGNFTTQNGTSEFTIELNPEFLGKINIKIISKDNEISASVKILNSEVKEALNSQTISITNYLKDQGIDIKNIEFTDFSAEMQFNSQDKSENNQRETKHNEENVFLNIFNNKKTTEYNEKNNTVEIRKYGKVNYFA